MDEWIVLGLVGHNNRGLFHVGKESGVQLSISKMFTVLLLSLIGFPDRFMNSLPLCNT